jgi:hypothetical protein
MANSNVLGKVTSLIVTKGKDNRGSNSVIRCVTVKEQRVDGNSYIFFKDEKVG